MSKFYIFALLICTVLLGCSGADQTSDDPVDNRAQMAEAQILLKQIHSMQRVYHQSTGQYWGQGVTASSSEPRAFSEIGVEVPPTCSFTFTITRASKDQFEVEARAVVNGQLRKLSIDQRGMVHPVS